MMEHISITHTGGSDTGSVIPHLPNAECSTIKKEGETLDIPIYLPDELENGTTLPQSRRWTRSNYCNPREVIK
jgi:hypothetical protein